MPQEGSEALPHVYVKSTVFSDAEPSRPVTFLNVLHPGVENICMIQCEEDENYILGNNKLQRKEKGSQGGREGWRQ